MAFANLFPPYTIPNIVFHPGVGTTFFFGWRLVNGVFVKSVRVNYGVFGVASVVSEAGFQIAAGSGVPASEAEFSQLALQLTSTEAGGTDFEDPVLVSAGIPTFLEFQCNFEADEALRVLAMAVHSQQATDVIVASMDWTQSRRRKPRGL